MHIRKGKSILYKWIFFVVWYYLAKSTLKISGVNIIIKTLYYPALHEVCENIRFHWPIFSLLSTEHFMQWSTVTFSILYMKFHKLNFQKDYMELMIFYWKRYWNCINVHNSLRIAFVESSNNLLNLKWYFSKSYLKLVSNIFDQIRNIPWDSYLDIHDCKFVCRTAHCLKIARIWSLSGSFFPTFRLNTEQSECGKIR